MQLCTALLVGVVSMPAASMALFQSTDDDGVNLPVTIDLHKRAWENRDKVRSIRRNYWRAVEIYRYLDAQGVENLYPPDVNDIESVNMYLNPEIFEQYNVDVFHPSAGEPGSFSDAKLRYKQLSERWQDQLDGFITSGRCPESIRRHPVSGFYDLCVDLLDDHIAGTRQDLRLRSAYLRGYHSLGYSNMRNLRRRLEYLEESLNVDGAYVRPRTHSGNRPRLDYSSYR